MASPRGYAAVSLLRLLLLASLACFTRVSGAIYTYTNTRLPAQELMFRRAGMYAPSDAPHTGPPGYGRSTIKIDLRLTRESDDTVAYDAALPTELEVLVFDAPHFSRIGWVPKAGAPKVYCCSAPAIAAGVCATPNTLIVQPDRRPKLGKFGLRVKSISNWRVRLPAGGKVVRVRQQREVKVSGLYYVMFASCNPASGATHIAGSTEWLNPYGYLPGDLYGNLPFFGWLALAYVVGGFLWAGLMAAHMDELIQLQYWITLVLGLGMLETLSRYHDFERWNAHGVRDDGAMLFAVLCGTTKRALSRVLVLIVSMGYGTTKPTLGETMGQVLSLGALYLGLATVQEFYFNLSHSLPTGLLEFGLLFGLSLLDVAFIFWIFKSLLTTLHTLAQRRQLAKLALFRRLRDALGFWCAVACVWAAYTMVLTSSRAELASHWQDAWWNDALWHVFYAAVLSIVAFLWRPSTNALRYASFAGEVTARERRDRGWGDDDEGEYGGLPQGDDYDDDVVVEMTSAGAVLSAMDEDAEGGPAKTA